MGDGKERPRAGDTPKLSEPLEILKMLLDVEQDRLTVALRIEKERDIVFPETTVIIRDVERLMMEIEKREEQPESEPQIEPPMALAPTVKPKRKLSGKSALKLMEKENGVQGSKVAKSKS
jgi:hypothetical protein